MAHHWLVARAGAVAQLGERRLCKAEVGGSSPPGSTNNPAPAGRAHRTTEHRCRGTTVTTVFVVPRQRRFAVWRRWWRLRHLHNGILEMRIFNPASTIALSPRGALRGALRRVSRSVLDGGSSY
jgi:hypothetical protein